MPTLNAEGEVAAYAPGNAFCPTLTSPTSKLLDADGRLIFTSGESQSIIVRDIKTGTTIVTPVATGLGMVPDGQVAPQAKKSGIVAYNQLFGEDNQVVVLPDRSLLLVWAGWTATDVWTPKGQPLPPWWDATDPNAFDGGADVAMHHKGWRGALFMWRSTDCGRDWSKPIVFDSATVTVIGNYGYPTPGLCGWPQQATDAQGNAVANKWHPGGWDREQIYADPFKHRVYMTVGCTTGTYTQNPNVSYPPGATPPNLDFTVLFSSSSGNPDSWDYWGVAVPNASLPTVMTTTADGRLFLLSCVPHGSIYTPWLFWSDDQGQSIAGYTASFVWPNYDALPACASLTQSEMPGHILPNIFNPTISRVSSVLGLWDKVRIAWMQRVGDRVGERVAMVTVPTVFQPNNTVANQVTTSLIGTVLASGPSDHAYQGAFIEASGPETHGLDGTAVLCWLESIHGYTSERYSVFRGTDQWTVAGWLSVRKDKGKNRGQYWTPSAWPGDYSYGTFYSTPGKLHYVAQWTGSFGTTFGTDFIAYNTVSIPGT